MKNNYIYEYAESDYKRYNNDNFNWGKFIRCYFDTLSETRLLSYIITYRICNYLYKRNNKFLLFFFKIRLRKLQLKFGVEISYKTIIGKGLRISHGFGIVIHHNAVIGNNFTILQNCTIGNNINKSRNEVASIGNDVTMGAGAKIIGPIKIGNNVTIGANAVVTHDIMDNCTCVGVPAKVIK